MSKTKRVVVGLSGGVDSSVAAYMLKQQGYDVVGIFMRNWNDDSVIINNECPWIDDSNDALLVAQKLNIPFQTIDLSVEYKKRIVDYMFAEYERGRTPNPDVLCNREVKFDLFLDIALSLRADFVATGHYCQKDSFDSNGKTIYRLLAGADTNKDQSYFLCQVSQQQLQYALFPIGHLQKHEVRRIAQEAGLLTAEKKDSQGLCFIGKVKLPDFLQQQLKPKKGDIIEISDDSALYNNRKEVDYSSDFDTETLNTITQPIQYHKSDGKIVQTHNGAHFYTIGQRKGLYIGGSPKPQFVIATDVENNLIYTGQGEDHKGLLRQGLQINNNEVHWIRNDLQLQLNEHCFYDVRIRYRQSLQKARLLQRENKLYILFKEPQRSIAKGQFAAWYHNNELVGSGVIA